MFVIVALCAAGCTEAAPGDSTSSAPFWAKETTQPSEPTAAPTTLSEYVSPATPRTVETGTPPAQAREIPEQQLSPDYPIVLIDRIDFTEGPRAWTINATHPPMVVEYVVTPKTVTFEDAYYSSYGDKDLVVTTRTRYDDNSFVEVTVYDENGEIVTQDGFSSTGKYDRGTEKELIVLRGGTYQVDIHGVAAAVDLTVRVGSIDGLPEVAV
ncbi:hypothetical protein CUJ86_04870 [Methanofollis fontis]|uniref:Uncharacterized protein n=2 Tax=Methanofollis fontis TaxID=2052832 RepID=A0A483CR37_9EURY|nr:hypothetical protein CUJ86_04870 [Methanofollis fontis]